MIGVSVSFHHILLAVVVGVAGVWSADPTAPPLTDWGPVVFPACGEAFLPTDLDLITTVEQTDVRETHLHGRYRIGNDRFVTHLRGFSRNLTLKYSEMTEFRLSIAPEDAATFRIALYTHDDQTLVTQSAHGGTAVERMIYAELHPNVNYDVMFVYTLGATQDRCPRVLMELAAQPKRLARKFVDSCDLAADPLQGAPEPMVPAAPAGYYFEYRSQPGFVTVGAGAAAASDDSGVFSVVGYHTVTVPYLAAHHNQWLLRVRVHANFLDGGDVVAIVTEDNGVDGAASPPTPDVCALAGECLYGIRSTRNQLVLEAPVYPDRAAGAAGKYRLWIVRRKAESKLDRTCVPVEVDVVLHPLPANETALNCAAELLPPSMDEPGLYNNRTGVLRFNADVLLNLSVREQRTMIRPVKPRSLLRAFLADHDAVDGDLLLYDDNNNMLATSLAFSGPEGLVYELEGGKTYFVSVAVLSGLRRYSDSSHDYVKLCDTIELQLHVFPVTTESSNQDTCSTVSPAVPLATIQSNLDANKDVSFGSIDADSPPYSFTINSNDRVKQYTMDTAEGGGDMKFTITRNTYFVAIVTADTYGGTPQMVLKAEGGDSKYSVPRTVGSGLAELLTPGIYTVALLTPYIQTTSKTWSAMSTAIPTCVRYNLKLRISSTDGCIAPLQLPTGLTVTPHGHHHLFDMYHVPFGGAAEITLQHTQEATLHAKIGASDVPIHMSLYEGHPASPSVRPLANGQKVFGADSEELFVNLNANTQYVLRMDFNGHGVADSCQAFLMQLSLVPTPPAPLAGHDDAGDLVAHCDADEGGATQLINLDQTIDVEMKQTMRSVAQAADRKSSVLRFAVREKFLFRVLLDYDFTVGSSNVAVCPCSVPSQCAQQCQSAPMYFNGFEVPTIYLLPGEYSLVLSPWTGSMINGRDLAADCTSISMHIVAAPSVSASAVDTPPAFCPTTMQYLPPTLNTVGFLHPFYKEEVHFLQHVKVNTKHRNDRTKFRVTQDTIVRIFMPSHSVHGYTMLKTGDGSRYLGIVSPGGSLYRTLSAGEYVLDINFMYGFEKNGGCSYVPLEIALVAKASLAQLVEGPPEQSLGDSQCVARPPELPKSMFHHGHDTMYRKVEHGAAFSDKIPFNVTSPSGGNVDIDIRSNFEVASLAAVLTGHIDTADGSQLVSFHFKHYPDRAFLNTDVPRGSYTLLVYDPTGTYKEDTDVVDCTPFSYHLRLVGGPVATPLPVPGQTPTPATPAPTPEAPHLACPWSYDVMPSEVPAGGSTGETRRLDGTAFQIPFRASSAVGGGGDTGGEEEGNPFGSAKHAVVSTTVRLSGGDTFRVWVSTAASVRRVTLRVHRGASAEGSPLKVSMSSGSTSTQTMAYRAASSFESDGGDGQGDGLDHGDANGAGTIYTLVMDFEYTHAPVFQRDYAECGAKQTLTSFALLASVFPSSRLGQLALCGDGSSGDGAGVYPPAQISLSKRYAAIDKDYFFTKRDCKLQCPAGWPTGGAGGTPHQGEGTQFYEVATCERSVEITVPTGASDVTLAMSTTFNMLLSDMRLVLESVDNGTQLQSQYGTPSRVTSGKYNAEIGVLATSVVPGTYRLRIRQAFVDRASVEGLASVCVPFKMSMLLDGKGFGPGPTPPPAAIAPKVVGISPDSTVSLDPRGTFAFELETDTSLDKSFRPAQQYPIVLQDSANGNSALMPSRRFYSGRRKLRVMYQRNQLRWNWPYTSAFDGSALKARHPTPGLGGDAPLEFVLDSGLTLPTYRTARCGCDDDVCASGSLCPCVLELDQCYRCPDGMRLSTSELQIGPTGDPQTVNGRVCIVAGEDVETPSPPTKDATTRAPPATQKPSGTASPHGSSSGTESPAAHHHGGSTTTTPSPPPASSGPTTTAPTAGDTRPPLKWLRVLLSAAFLITIAVFAVWRIVAFAQRRGIGGGAGGVRRQAVNPFRRVSDEDAGSDRFAVGMGGRTGGRDAAEDENDGGDDGAFGRPAPARRAPQLATGAAASVPNEDEDADENASILA